MQFNSKFFSQAGINPDIASDLTFTVLDTKSSELIGSSGGSRPQKHSTSVGSIQTLLGMHRLMAKSLSMVSPNLVFSADFPDYLISEDNPEYMKSLPILTPELYQSMPHFRWDLYERNFDDYGSIENVPAPHVTWGVVRTEPGTVSGTPFRGTQELKPRQREIALVFDAEYKSTLEANSDNNFIEKDGKLYKFIRVYGQAFDNLVQYNCWARSAWEAEELIEWFHKGYLLPYTGMFREAGINQMLFQRRVRDDTIAQIKNRFHLRSMLYYIRTEHILNDNIMPINRVDVNMDVLANTADTVISNNVGNYYDQLLDNWHS